MRFNMKFLYLLPILYLTGCLFGLEKHFPDKYHKCSSLSGWCVNTPAPEIVYWAIKDDGYKVTEPCCSVVWD